MNWLYVLGRCNLILRWSLLWLTYLPSEAGFVAAAAEPSQVFLECCTPHSLRVDKNSDTDKMIQYPSVLTWAVKVVSSRPRVAADCTVEYVAEA